jgi:hypothetical protein
MSDEVKVDFSPEQTLKMAQSNAKGLIFGSLAFLKHQSLSMNQFWAFVGNLVAPNWEAIDTLKEFVEMIALAIASLGGNLHSLSHHGSKAKIVVGGWPSEESLKIFGLTLDEADSFWCVFCPIAESLFICFEWNRAGDEVTLNFSSC